MRGRTAAVVCAMALSALLAGCSGTYTAATVLKGKVTDAGDGSVVRQAMITLGKTALRVDENGAYIFEKLSPGVYTYEVSAPEYAGQSGNLSIKVGVNRRDFALVHLTHGEVGGRVTDQTTGESVGGALVLLGDGRTSADAEGRFLFSEVDPGTYRLEVTAGGYGAWNTVLDVTLARMELAVALARAGLTGRIAFSGIVSGKRDIYIMDAAGGNRTPLTTAGAGCFRPALSPDGSQVLYAYETGGIRRIFVMNSDGSQVTAITAGPSDDYPAWSPDGRRIAFQSVRYGSNHIIVASSNGTGEVDLGPGRFPTWSPEGDKVAFVTSGQIHICPAAGGGAVPIGPDTGAYYPAWSPDGLCITLSLKEGTDAYGLYVLTIATGDLRRLAGGRSHLRSAFSPDGSMVAYHTVGTESAATQIYIVAAAGGVPLWVSRSGGESHDPSWR